MRFPRRGVVIASISALLLVRRGIFLLGVSGAICMELTVALVELLPDAPQGSLVRGHAGWPTALRLMLALPLSLPVVLWIGMRPNQGRMWPALLVTLVGLWT